MTRQRGIPRPGVAGLLAAALTLAPAGLAAQNQPAGYPAGAWKMPLTWWVASRTTGYWYESIDPATGATQQRPSFLQGVDGSVAQLWDGHLDLRFAARFARADLYPGFESNDSRWYVGYAQVRAAPWKVRGRLGRMFLQEGPAHHTLDGAWIGIEPLRRVALHAWGGTQAPDDLDFDVRSIESFQAYGARVLGTLAPELQLALSYAQWDEEGEVAERPVGAEVTWFPLGGLRTFARAEYETEEESWRRLEVLADYVPRRGSPWLFRAQALERTPWIENTSYFSRFDDLERIRAARASARYQRPDGFGGEFESFTSVLDTRTSWRLGGAVLFKYGRLGYSALFGDSGEESQWFGNVDVPVQTWVRVAAGAVVSTYALFEDAPEAEERDLITLFGRATVEPWPGVRGVAEVQGLQTPDFDHDVRVLLGLDLLAGRGATSFGLGRTGGAAR